MDYLGSLISTPSIWYALLTWPKFSLTSFHMVSSLKRQGIEPKAVIDVGANVGQFAVACAKIFPGIVVHSFEPLPECVEKLRQNAAKLAGVRVYPTALGGQGGKVVFHVNSHTHSSSILSLGGRHRQAFPAAKETRTIEVPISTLDWEMRA